MKLDIKEETLRLGTVTPERQGFCEIRKNVLTDYLDKLPFVGVDRT